MMNFSLLYFWWKLLDKKIASWGKVFPIELVKDSSLAQFNWFLIFPENSFSSNPLQTKNIIHLGAVFIAQEIHR